jgi:hypothetical protein
MQPFLGLVAGLIIVLLSAKLHWKTDKKAKAGAISVSKGSLLRTVSSVGIAMGGLMIIVAIKFLTS